MKRRNFPIRKSGRSRSDFLGWPAFRIFGWVFFFVLSGCAAGSNSGGGGLPGDDRQPLSYSAADLQGIWDWRAVRQSSGDVLTGTMTFAEAARLIGFTLDACAGQQDYYAEFWIWEDGYVKGRIFGVCSDPMAHMKFSMDFQEREKKIIQGLMDLHYLVNGQDTYDRYEITLIKRQGLESSPGLKADHPSKKKG